MANFRHVTKCRGGSGGDLPSFLPSGPLPHAEAGAFPDLKTLGVPSLLCTRVSFELCAYTRESRKGCSGKSEVRSSQAREAGRRRRQLNPDLAASLTRRRGQ